MRIYLDACVIIYLVDASETYHARVVDLVRDFNSDRDARLLTSRLSRMECRVRAIKNQQAQLIARYEQFFSASRLDLLEIDAAVIERATQLRVDYSFRSPDAIHLASAMESSSDIFLTGDLELRKCKEIPVQVVT